MLQEKHMQGRTEYRSRTIGLWWSRTPISDITSSIGLTKTFKKKSVFKMIVFNLGSYANLFETMFNIRIGNCP